MNSSRVFVAIVAAVGITVGTLLAVHHKPKPPPAPVPAGELVLPNAAVTPGAVSTLTQAQVCAGQKDTRPPQSFTTGLKQRQLSDGALGYAGAAPWRSDKTLNHYEEDHLVALELGGSGSSVKNLWPEPGPNIGNPADVTFHNNAKDALEGWLHARVCSGKEPLTQAQRDIATDWISAWRAAGKPHPIPTPPYYAGGM